MLVIFLFIVALCGAIVYWSLDLICDWIEVLNTPVDPDA